MIPKITVLLPVYNGQKTIAKAVESILNQTFSQFELLIIDDGSTDNTVHVIESFSDDRLNVHKIRENGGIARALNFGLKLAKSPFIARMDADDISLPARLEKQYQYIVENPSCGVISSLVEYKGNRTKQQGYAHYVKQINKIVTPEDLRNKRFQESPIAHPSVMFRKELVEQFGGYSEASIPEDYELWLRWMHQGVQFNKLEDNLLIWNDLPSRISRSSLVYSDEKFYKLKAFYLAKQLQKTNDSLPKLWVWGTGRTVNKHSNYLSEAGFEIEKYISLKDSSSKKHIHFSEIQKPGSFVIVSYVRDRIGKKDIEEFLNIKGFEEGQDFFLMS